MIPIEPDTSNRNPDDEKWVSVNGGVATYTAKTTSQKELLFREKLRKLF